jgi:hypothetical protein
MQNVKKAEKSLQNFGIKPQQIASLERRGTGGRIILSTMWVKVV